jgi:mannobiose 2-epimerase
MEADQWRQVILTGLGIVLFSLLVANCQNREAEKHTADTSQHLKIAEEIDSVLTDQYQLWYPRTVDEEYGGFLSRFTYDWQPEGVQDKFIVTQSRHVWASSNIAYTDENHPEMEKYSEHGYKFLKDVMWDQEHGGFYNMVSREGEVITEEDGSIRKQLYGNAFAIYGLASYYQLSENEEVLELAKKAFHWLDKGAYDPEYGGYFDDLNREGQPIDSAFPKDYNSSIHMLEALAELHQVWPDSLVRERLHEMFRIVRDTIVTDKGYMNLYFEENWSPIVYRDSSREVQKENLDVDHITFGHDIETAFLLLEAAHSLEFSADSTLSLAKKMVDHTIDHGWDEEEGGIYDYGYYFQGDDSLTVTQTSKEWWSQAEALHSLLIMARYFPDDPRNYFDRFTRQWEYIKQYMLDSEHGGWYRSGIDENPEAAELTKASIWKGNYHTVRSLLRSRDLLREMNQH